MLRSFASAAALIFALALPATLAAEEVTEPAATSPDRVEVTDAAPPAAALRLTPVESRATRDASDAVDAAQFQRGSFWWYVGIIVVAGVILAVVA